jgi:hypothetical protein
MSPMQWASAVGCANCFRSFIDPLALLHLSSVTMTIYMSANPVHHKRTKHIEIDIHFVCEKVSLGDVRVLHVPSAL